jgi:hypothetical protein
MPHDHAGDHRDVEPTQPDRPGPRHNRIKPMRPERRLGPGNSVLIFPAPTAPGDAARDGRAGDGSHHRRR